MPVQSSTHDLQSCSGENGCVVFCFRFTTLFQGKMSVQSFIFGLLHCFRGKFQGKMPVQSFAHD